MLEIKPYSINILNGRWYELFNILPYIVALGTENLNAVFAFRINPKSVRKIPLLYSCSFPLFHYANSKLIGKIFTYAHSTNIIYENGLGNSGYDQMEWAERNWKFQRFNNWKCWTGALLLKLISMDCILRIILPANLSSFQSTNQSAACRKNGMMKRWLISSKEIWIYLMYQLN